MNIDELLNVILPLPSDEQRILLRELLVGRTGEFTDVDQLIDLIQGLPSDVERRLLLGELLTKGADPEHFDNSNFVVEAEAFLQRAKLRSQETLNQNVAALQEMITTVADGRPTQAVVRASWSVYDNWLHTISDLIVPWKQFTNDI